MKIQWFRKNEWLHSKIPFLLGIVYLGAWNSNALLFEIWINILVLLFMIVAIASFGYFLNDSFDIQEDALMGKVNFASKFSLKQRFSILLALFVFGYVPWAFFSKGYFLFTLLAIHLILLLMYSVPPIRLKNRGMTALVFDAGYSFVLPVLVCFYYINDSTIDQFTIPLLIAWSATMGIRNIMQHHRNDAQFDSISLTYNISNQKGENKVKFLTYNLLVPLEFIIFIFLLISFGVSYGYFLLILGVFLIAEVAIHINDIGFRINKIFGSQYSSINSFYEYIFPNYMILLLITRIDTNYLIVLLVHNIIFFNSLLYSYIKFSSNMFKISKWILLFDKIKSNLR
jgi:hypothetical protein